MDVFDPVKYSLAENKFFLKHLGESPITVLKESLPPDVNAATTQEVLGTIYQLEEERNHRGWDWAGIAEVKKSIETYLTEWIRWKEMSARGAPRFPSMHTWDSRGRPHRGGIGSDSSKKVSTYIDKDGNRHAFALPLRDTPVEGFVPSWIKPEAPLPDDLDNDMDAGTVACPLCGWTTNYSAGSQAQLNLAKSRVAKHLKSAKEEPERHRDLWQKLFT